MLPWLAAHPHRTGWVVRGFDHLMLGESVPPRAWPAPAGGELLRIFRDLPWVCNKDTGERVCRLGDPVYARPTETHAEVRLSGGTYRVQVRCDVLDPAGRVAVSSVFLGYLPLMVGSALDPCPPFPDDTPGYFIVGGLEVSLVNQEEHRPNVPIFRYAKTKGAAEPRPEAYVPGYATKFSLELGMDDSPYVHVKSHSSRAVPLAHVLRVLGERRPMAELFPGRAFADADEAEAAETIASAFSREVHQVKPLQRAREAVREHVLAFIEDDDAYKAEYLLQASHRLLRMLQRPGETDEEFASRPEADGETDADSLEYKRVATPGTLLADLYQDVLTKYVTRLSPAADADLSALFDGRRSPLTARVETALATGNWIRRKNGYRRAVSRSECRASAQNVIRKVNVPLLRTSQGLRKRQVHGSQMHLMCLATTPEGKNIGLLKSPTFQCEITVRGDVAAWRAFLKRMCRAGPGGMPVLLNEHLVGRADSADEVVARARGRKRDVDEHASVVLDGGRVLVDCTEGRPVCAFWRLPRLPDEDGKSWDRLLRDGHVEYLDAREQRRAGVKLLSSPDVEDWHTHEELHDAAVFAEEASKIPYANFSQGPRIQFGGVMSNAAAGVATYDTERRPYQREYRLAYPQRPLLETDVARWAKARDPASGEVLDHPYTQDVVLMFFAAGENQEDSLVFARSFLERGGLLLVATESVHHTLDRGTEFGLPDVPGRTWADVDPDTGVIRKGAEVRDGTVLMIKRRGKAFAGEVRFHLTSPPSAGGYVYRVARVDRCTDAKTGTDKCVVTITHLRPGAVGDKFASRHGQKGVMGAARADADMPFFLDTERGPMRPDAMMNPHAIPSRMTIGHMIEMMAGRLCCADPSYARGIADPTPFSTAFSLPAIKEELHRLGFSRVCEERVVDPFTGELCERPALVGVISYMRLVYFAMDKISCRAMGPYSQQNWQPTKGKKRAGGQRVGEMEKDAVLSHGAGWYFDDKFYRCSDGIDCAACAHCGAMLAADAASCRCAAGAAKLKRRRTCYAAVNMQSTLRVAGVDWRYA